MTAKPPIATVDPSEQARQRQKAKELRASQWWKQQLGMGICYYCGGRFSKDQLTMDHVVPISRGGKSNKKNVVVCCKGCNNRKKNLMPVELTMQAMDSDE